MKNKIYCLIILIAMGGTKLCYSQCQDITVFLQRTSYISFEVAVNPSDVYTGNYAGVQNLSLSQDTFVFLPFSGISDIGPNLVTLTITDSSGNTTTCVSTVNVFMGGSVPPQALCKDITVQLDENGSASITPLDIDNGSISADGIQFRSLDRNSFTCDDIGQPVTVTLIVTDINGFSDSCTAIVTVEDTIKPNAKCKNVTIPLDRNGQLHLLGSMVDDGSSDACDLIPLDVDRNFFTCADLGPNTVTLTATDNNTNTDTCTCTVTLVDETPPEAYCKTIQVLLNSSGLATITPGDVNNNSFEACGTPAFQLDKTKFNCSNVGVNKVILTVSDTKGNTSTCAGIVDVVNLVRPDANCRNIILNLDKFGHAAIVADDINNGSTAVCGIKDITLDTTEFTSADRGDNTVTLTVTDNTGVSETCTAIVTVIPHDSLVGRVFNTSNTSLFSTNNFPLLEIDGNNNVMAGSTGSGLYIYKDENWINVFNQFGMNGFITRAMRRNPANNEIWIGMSKSSPCLGQVGGVWVYSDGFFLRRYTPPPPPGGISETSSVLEMNSFLAASGFGFVLPGGSTYLDFLSAYNFSLPSLVARSLDFNKSTNFPWVGCTPQVCEPGYNGGLAVLPLVDFTAIKAGMPPQRNGDTFITAITSSSDGTVYSGVGRSCYNSCLPAYILKSSVTGDLIEKYDNSNTPLPLTTASTSNAIRALCVDKHNRLWVGGELNGIGVLDTNGWHFLQNPVIPYNNNSFVNFDAITEGPDGTMFFGTSNGLLIFLGGDVTDGRNWNLLYLKATNVTSQGAGMQNIGSIKFDSNNNMWIGTRGEGIFYIKTPVVYNLAVNLNKGKVTRRPFQGVKVTAIDESTSQQVGNVVITNEKGEFLAQIDQHLDPSQSYTLKFRYGRNIADSLDRDFEFDFPAYSPELSIDDILMPVKILRQTRELLYKIKFEKPNVPRKYDVRVFEFSFIDSAERKIWDFTKVNEALDSSQKVNDATVDDKIQNLSRMYVALYVHHALSDDAMVVCKILPKALVSMVTTLLSIAPARMALREVPRNRTRRATGTSAVDPEVQAKEAAESFETGAGHLMDAVKLGLDELKSHFSGNTRMEHLIDDLKAYLESASPIAISSINAMAGGAKPKDVIDKVLSLLKDKLTTLCIIGLYTAYISETQAEINEAAHKLKLNIHPGGNFESGAANALQVMTEMDQYISDVKSRTDMFFANTESESITTGSVNTISAGANAYLGEGNIREVVSHAGLTARDVVTKIFPLARLISTGFSALNVVAAAEEAVRGCITLISKQADVNDKVFNPGITPPVNIPPVNSPQGLHTMSTIASIDNEVNLYNQKLDIINGLIQSNDNIGAWNKIAELSVLDSAINTVVKNASERYSAIAYLADSLLPTFNIGYNYFTSGFIKVFSCRASYNTAMAIWFSDTTDLVHLDTLPGFADSLKVANNQMNSSLQEMESLTDNFTVNSRATITHITGPQLVGHGTTNSYMVAYKNFGINTADSLYILNSLDGGFSISPDSIFIGTVTPGDTGHFVVNITSPAVDALTVSRFALHISSGIGDSESYLIESGEPCLSLYYIDKDDDGFGNVDLPFTACTSPAGFVNDSTDCNDSTALARPGANEICNGIDDNCNGQIDEGAILIFYRDVDGDGYGNPAINIQGCSPSLGYVTSNTDCNDTIAGIYPGGAEVCNEIDDNCNGQIDEGVKLTFYLDSDGDGFGNPVITIEACLPPGGFVANHADCNDARAYAHPGMPELCNSIDDNCDGHIDPGCGSHKYFADTDGDNFGNPNSTISTNALTPPVGYVIDSTDCMDTNLNVHPGGTEVCNGLDDNCSGGIDEGVLVTFYRDADGDGFGTAVITTQACSAPSGFVVNSTDCNDGNALVYPGRTEVCNGTDDNCNGQTDEGAQFTFFRDADADGFGNAALTIQGCTAPSGFVANNADCNDGNAAIRPGGTEVCNVADDNCNGQTDEGVTTTFYRDIDGDGFGNAGVTIQACSAPAGFVANSTDCNDGNAAIRPGGTEVCNGTDDNCNGQTDEGVNFTFYRDADGDGFGNIGVTTQACTLPAGFVTNSTDCNDGNAAIRPGGTEICNGVDENCNGQIDEGVKTTFFRDADGDGFGNAGITTQACSAPAGFVVNSTDCNDGRAATHPGAPEVCNGIDENCNGQIDEGVKLTFYRDADNDGFGNPGITTLACSVPAGFVVNNTDCNDGRTATHPGATEVCNGIDDNCNGTIDEGVKILFFRDVDGDGFGNPNITNLACTPAAGFVANSTDCNDGNAAIHPGATEICNGIDDNCDGVIDAANCDLDGDGFTIGQGDCNDNNPNVHPGATELCNGIDDNCNGITDEGLLLTFYSDADGDGFGNIVNSLQGCFAPPGFVVNSTDCNDGNSTVHPGATEICNGIDDNCNGTTDEGLLQTFFRDSDGDGFGNVNITSQGCSPPSGFVVSNTDCNDGNANVNPGHSEVCGNGIDDNCNGTVDEGCDQDGDGYTVAQGDCNDNNPNVHPGATEVCNGIDDNCNGSIDEGVIITFYRDADGDGFGNIAIASQACSAPAGFVTNSTDCNDGNANVYPGHAEVCGNGIDDNCNGQIDEGGTAPATPGVITAQGGNTAVCPGTTKTYSVVAVPNATGYTWTPPTGGSITSGQNTRIVTILYTAGFIANGTLTVTADNGCTHSALRSLAIARNTAAPGTPGNITITGNAPYCGGTARTFTVPAVAGLTYSWSPAGNVQSGQGTNSVVFNLPVVAATTSFTASVRAVSACGILSPARNRTINVSPCGTRIIAGESEGIVSESKLIIFPNPAGDEASVVFSASEAEKYKLQIIDVTGKVLTKIEGTSATGENMIPIDLHGYSEGIYFLSLLSDIEKPRTIKFVKQ